MRARCSSNAHWMLFRCTWDALQMRGQCSSDACSMPRMLNQCSLNAQTMSFQCQFKQCSFNAQIMSIQSEFDSQRMLIKCSSMPKNLEKSQKSVPESQKIQSPRHEEAFGERKKTFSATSQGSRIPDAQKSRSRLPWRIQLQALEFMAKQERRCVKMFEKKEGQRAMLTI